MSKTFPYPSSNTAPGVSGGAVVRPAPAVAIATRSAVEGAGESKQALTERALKDPGVNRLLKEFGAQVVDVRPVRPAVDDGTATLPVEENG